MPDSKTDTTIEPYAGGWVAKRGSAFLASGLTKDEVQQKMADGQTTVPWGREPRCSICGWPLKASGFPFCLKFHRNAESV